MLNSCPLYKSLLSLLLIFTGLLSAQDFYQLPLPANRYFQVEASLVDSLLQEKIDHKALFKRLQGRAHANAAEEAALPNGHFIQATLIGEQLKWRYFSRHQIQAYAGRIRDKFSLRLLTPTGQLISNAKVLADGKKVGWSERDSAYLRRDWKIDLLQIQTDTDTLFFKVDEQINFSRIRHDWRHLKRNKPMYYLLTPVRLVDRSWAYLKRGIGRGNWNWYTYPFQGEISRLANPPKSINGYVTVSKPQYRPGDTLRLSAYLAQPNGRPLRDSVIIRITANGIYQQHLQKTVAVSEVPGRYIFKTVIPAHWPLDKTYTIRFSRKGNWRRQIDPRINFKVADYELQEYKLEATMPDTLIEGIPFLIDITAQDINKQPLIAGEIEVLVMPTIGIDSKSDQPVCLPDSLYYQQETMDGRQALTIALPDSIFPAAYRFEALVTVKLKGPSGEYKEVNQSIIVDRRNPLRPQLTVKGSQLWCTLTGQQNTTVAATLYRFSSVGIVDSVLITLPHHFELESQVHTYALRYQDLLHSKEMGDLVASSGQPANWFQDTLVIYFHNAHRLPLNWQLYQERQLIAQGDRSSRPFSSSGYKAGSTLRLQYRYQSGGIWKAKELPIKVPVLGQLTDHEQELHIDIVQPERVTPGQLQTVTVKVAEQNGAPAEGVALTAGTINARFTEEPFSTPVMVSRKRSRARQLYDLVTPAHQQYTDHYPSALLHDFDRTEHRFYQLRNPQLEYRHSRSLDSLLPAHIQQAYLAPFLVEEGRLKTVHLIYVDDQLQYFHDANIYTPYTVAVDTGWHQITLRGAKYAYSKRLYFSARQQLIISFDINFAGSAGWAKTKVGSTYTKAEKFQLSRRVFGITKMAERQIYSIREPGRPISTAWVNGKGWQPVGIVQPGSVIDFWFAKQDSLKLTYESGFVYSVKPDRDRLYPMPSHAFTKYLTDYNPRQIPGIPHYQSPPLTAKQSNPLQLIKKDYNGLSLPYRNARLQIIDLPSPRPKLAVGTKYEAYTAQLAIDRVNYLPPEDLYIYYIFGPDSIRRQTVNLSAHQLCILPYRAANTILLDSTNFASDRFFQRHQTYPQTTQYIPPFSPASISYLPGESTSQITGTVLDETGMGLPFVTILIEGTKMGTSTDFDGNFSLDLPSNSASLMFSYTGYESKRLIVHATNGKYAAVEIMMAPSAEYLNEVVVIGYSVAHIEQDNTTSVSVQLQGRSSGAAYYVDGIRVGAPSRNRTQQIKVRGLQTLASAQAKLEDIQQAILEENRLNYEQPPINEAIYRSDFRDLAAWAPVLTTNARGEASFDIQFPDDITAWNTFVIGQDRQRRVGLSMAQTKAFLPFQAQLYIPRFLVAGDRSEARTLAINRTEQSTNVALTFGEGEKPLTQIDTLLEQVIEQSFTIQAPSKHDSISLQFGLSELAAGDHNITALKQDGEKRTIPIYPRGTQLTTGELFVLNNNTTPLPTNFMQAHGGPVQLRLWGNYLAALLNDLDRIVAYPYDCNEQSASRLIGLLAVANIRAKQGEVFKDAQKIPPLIRRLGKAVQADGGYGWWPSSESSSPWVTHHVYRALRQAAQAGYTVPDLTNTRRYLLAGGHELSLAGHAQLLLTMAEEGIYPDSTVRLRFDTLRQVSDYVQLARLRIAQLSGDTVSSAAILALSHTEFGKRRYFGKQEYWFIRQPLSNQLACSLLGYQLLQTAGLRDEAMEVINYLLGQKAAPQASRLPYLGTNTLESAILINQLLPDLLNIDQPLAPPMVTLTTANERKVIEAFPYSTELSITAAKTANLSINSGGGPVLAAVYQSWFTETPEASDNGLKVSSRLVTAKGLQLAQLTKGQTAYLEVQLQSTATGDYVMLEVPIPAGCSYADRQEANGPYAVHRSYQRDRVAIFMDHLPAGQHTYRIALAPRFTGDYTLNPARAELQYLPLINGHSPISKISIN